MNVLVIAPHPDDAELGMGGTIYKLANNGNNVYILDLTNGEPTPHGSPEIRMKEAEKAAKVLKIKKRITLEFPNRYLQDKIDYRIEVAEHIRDIRPEILLIPNNIDAHPDHIAAHSIGLAARFYAKLTKTDMRGEPFYPTKLLYYHCSHMKLNLTPSFVIPLSKKEFNMKLKAINMYKSQFSYSPNKRIPDIIESMGRYWGNLVGSDYGEPFFTYEILGINNLTDILV